MLAAIDVHKPLARMLADRAFYRLVVLVELRPLESIQEYASQSLVEVLLDTCNDLLEDVGIRRPRAAMN